MKSILITGGSGSIGKSFIRKYYDKYEFFNVSRDENLQKDLIREFPKVNNFVSSVEDSSRIISIFGDVRPDIVIHTAAMKHIDTVEKNPIQSTKVNVLGSLSIINASIKYNVPITIGISTDKACLPGGSYGYQKFLMEKCFINANTGRNRFALCRFANVAHSSSSVIPLWLKMKSEGKPLKLTDKRMNRLIFSLEESSEFIHKTIDLCNDRCGGFVGVNIGMKTANMYDLAKLISNDIEIIGKISEDEKFDEDLISEGELPYTYVYDKGYIMIFQKKPFKEQTLRHSFGSHNAQKMNQDEMEKIIYGTSNSYYQKT